MSDPLAIRCPYCCAAPGQKCHQTRLGRDGWENVGERMKFHAQRCERRTLLPPLRGGRKERTKRIVLMLSADEHARLAAAAAFVGAGSLVGWLREMAIAASRKLDATPAAGDVTLRRTEP